MAPKKGVASSNSSKGAPDAERNNIIQTARPRGTRVSARLDTLVTEKGGQDENLDDTEDEDEVENEEVEEVDEEEEEEEVEEIKPAAKKPGAKKPAATVKSEADETEAEDGDDDMEDDGFVRRGKGKRRARGKTPDPAPDKGRGRGAPGPTGRGEEERKVSGERVRKGPRTKVIGKKRAGSKRVRYEEDEEDVMVVEEEDEEEEEEEEEGEIEDDGEAEAEKRENAPQVRAILAKVDRPKNSIPSHPYSNLTLNDQEKGHARTGPWKDAHIMAMGALIKTAAPYEPRSWADVKDLLKDLPARVVALVRACFTRDSEGLSTALALDGEVRKYRPWNWLGKADAFKESPDLAKLIWQACGVQFVDGMPANAKEGARTVRLALERKHESKAELKNAHMPTFAMRLLLCDIARMRREAIDCAHVPNALSWRVLFHERYRVYESWAVKEEDLKTQYEQLVQNRYRDLNGEKFKTFSAMFYLPVDIDDVRPLLPLNPWESSLGMYEHQGDGYFVLRKPLTSQTRTHTELAVGDLIVKPPLQAHGLPVKYFPQPSPSDYLADVLLPFGRLEKHKEEKMAVCAVQGEEAYANVNAMYLEDTPILDNKTFSRTVRADAAQPTLARARPASTDQSKNERFQMWHAYDCTVKQRQRWMHRSDTDKVTTPQDTLQGVMDEAVRKGEVWRPRLSLDEFARAVYAAERDEWRTVCAQLSSRDVAAGRTELPVHEEMRPERVPRIAPILPTNVRDGQALAVQGAHMASSALPSLVLRHFGLTLDNMACLSMPCLSGPAPIWNAGGWDAHSTMEKRTFESTYFHAWHTLVDAPPCSGSCPVPDAKYTVLGALKRPIRPRPQNMDVGQLGNVRRLALEAAPTVYGELFHGLYRLPRLVDWPVMCLGRFRWEKHTEPVIMLEEVEGAFADQVPALVSLRLEEWDGMYDILLLHIPSGTPALYAFPVHALADSYTGWSPFKESIPLLRAFAEDTRDVSDVEDGEALLPRLWKQEEDEEMQPAGAGARGKGKKSMLALPLRDRLQGTAQSEPYAFITAQPIRARIRPQPDISVHFAGLPPADERDNDLRRRDEALRRAFREAHKAGLVEAPTAGAGGGKRSAKASADVVDDDALFSKGPRIVRHDPWGMTALLMTRVYSKEASMVGEEDSRELAAGMLSDGPLKGRSALQVAWDDVLQPQAMARHPCYPPGAALRHWRFMPLPRDLGTNSLSQIAISHGSVWPLPAKMLERVTLRPTGPPAKLLDASDPRQDSAGRALPQDLPTPEVVAQLTSYRDAALSAIEARQAEVLAREKARKEERRVQQIKYAAMQERSREVVSKVMQDAAEARKDREVRAGAGGPDRAGGGVDQTAHVQLASPRQSTRGPAKVTGKPGTALPPTSSMRAMYFYNASTATGEDSLAHAGDPAWVQFALTTPDVEAKLWGEVIAAFDKAGLLAQWVSRAAMYALKMRAGKGWVLRTATVTDFLLLYQQSAQVALQHALPVNAKSNEGRAARAVPVPRLAVANAICRQVLDYDLDSNEMRGEELALAETAFMARAACVNATMEMALTAARAPYAGGEPLYLYLYPSVTVTVTRAGVDESYVFLLGPGGTYIIPGPGDGVDVEGVGVESPPGKRRRMAASEEKEDVVEILEEEEEESRGRRRGAVRRPLPPVQEPVSSIRLTVPEEVEGEGFMVAASGTTPRESNLDKLMGFAYAPVAKAKRGR